MEESSALLIGRQTGDHLEIDVLHRYADSPNQWFDYGSLRCRVQIRAGGMRADFEATFRAEGFDNLRHDLGELERAFRPGVVEFEPGYEASLKFSIAAACVGPSGVRGQAIDGLGTGVEQRLTFEFGVTDSLREILASADRLARAFPPSPTSSLPIRGRQR
jgi:hypothetical protein